jgi:hypothetical protein
MMTSEALAMVWPRPPLGVVRMVFVIALVFVIATAAYAQLNFEHPPKKDPYGTLFGKRSAVQTTRPSEEVIGRGTPQPPVVVCGMRILPADPSIDPKIRVGPQARVIVDHKLRKLSPRICKPE